MTIFSIKSVLAVLLATLMFSAGGLSFAQASEQTPRDELPVYPEGKPPGYDDFRGNLRPTIVGDLPKPGEICVHGNTGRAQLRYRDHQKKRIVTENIGDYVAGGLILKMTRAQRVHYQFPIASPNFRFRSVRVVIAISNHTYGWVSKIALWDGHILRQELNQLDLWRTFDSPVTSLDLQPRSLRLAIDEKNQYFHGLNVTLHFEADSVPYWYKREGENRPNLGHGWSGSEPVFVQIISVCAEVAEYTGPQPLGEQSGSSAAASPPAVAAPPPLQAPAEDLAPNVNLAGRWRARDTREIVAFTPVSGGYAGEVEGASLLLTQLGGDRLRLEITMNRQVLVTFGRLVEEGPPGQRRYVMDFDPPPGEGRRLMFERLD